MSSTSKYQQLRENLNKQKKPANLRLTTIPDKWKLCKDGSSCRYAKRQNNRTGSNKCRHRHPELEDEDSVVVCRNLIDCKNEKCTYIHICPYGTKCNYLNKKRSLYCVFGLHVCCCKNRKCKLYHLRDLQ